MLVFRKKYFIWAIVLLITEAYIALYMHDAFIRPYFGDFLVVIFMYCVLRTFLQAPVLHVSVAVLALAYLVELSQYYQLIFKLGLQDSFLAHLVLGSTFHWFDMLAYTAGIAAVVIVEQINYGKTAQSDLR
jgi:hypothetical protein